MEFPIESSWGLGSRWHLSQFGYLFTKSFSKLLSSILAFLKFSIHTLLHTPLTFRWQLSTRSANLWDAWEKFWKHWSSSDLYQSIPSVVLPFSCLLFPQDGLTNIQTPTFIWFWNKYLWYGSFGSVVETQLFVLLDSVIISDFRKKCSQLVLCGIYTTQPKRRSHSNRGRISSCNNIQRNQHKDTLFCTYFSFFSLIGKQKRSIPLS